MKQTITNYTFNAATKTITLTDFTTINVSQILLIVNITDGIILYKFNDSTKLATTSTNVITLTYDTSSMSNTDKLLIIYDHHSSDPITIPLPSGAATSTKQDTTNTKLDTLNTYVDGLETLITSTNTKLDTLNSAQPTQWGLNDVEETGTYKYFGFESPSGSWKLVRKTLATGILRYSTGSSNYTTAWTDRATQTYTTYGTAF